MLLISLLKRLHKDIAEERVYRLCSMQQFQSLLKWAILTVLQVAGTHAVMLFSQHFLTKPSVLLYTKILLVGMSGLVMLSDWF